MDPVKKIKNRRGMTLVEVLIVVALMAILLGIAVPNLIREAQRIKMAELNGDARAVAVAVQSKLYGMKNAATSSEVSSFGLFNQTAASETDIHPTSDPENLRDVMYVSNFAQNTEDEAAVDKANAGKALLLSGALTDAQLLEEGKVLVFYTADTADVLEVFYSEEPFDIQIVTKLLEENQLVQEYLDQYRIGHYFGYGAEEPGRLEGMPLFTCNWIWDDELRLQIQMLTEPSPELLDKGLGMEVYLQYPALDDSGGKTDEMMIYAEGIFATDYKTGFVKTGDLSWEPDWSVIAKDTPLTLRKIKEEGKGVLNFALDSLIPSRTPYYIDGSGTNYKVKPALYHQMKPDLISVTQSLLYPRETLANWLDPTVNPFITVWFRQHRDTSNPGDSQVSDALFNLWLKSYIFGDNHTPTNYVNVDEYISLHVKLYVLETNANGEYITMPEWGTRTDGHHEGAGDARLRKPAESLRAADIYSHPISPYYYLLTEKGEEIALTSMRDLSNLSYVFNGVKNKVSTAKLYGNITGNQFIDKLRAVRLALINGGAAGAIYVKDFGQLKDNDPTWTVGNQGNHPDWGGPKIPLWDIFSLNSDVSVKSVALSKPFTIDGTKPDGKGSYQIKNLAFTGELGGTSSAECGGLFEYARDCTFKNIDIVNCRVWRQFFHTDALTEKEGNITSIDSDTSDYAKTRSSGGLSGALVGMAVNCSFEKVRAYIDENDNLFGLNISYYWVNGTVIGGLVGVAIGGKDAQDPNLPEFQHNNTTTFENCAASVRLTISSYDPSAAPVFAGGLVGIAMGNVKIQNSYAACELSSYYAGGLIGATLSDASWSFTGKRGFKGNGTVTDAAPSVKNSFAAGKITRGTRIGAGLIADVQGNAPDVSGCYSAAWWEIIPPVAYGTFEGDTKNYYVYQTRFAVPVTMNVEAWFVCEGDVLSLQGAGKNGKPCTGGDLAHIDELSAMTGGATLDATFQWGIDRGELSGYKRYWRGTGWHDGEYKEGEKLSYPFPMPEGNTDFWGEWIMPGCYETKETLNGGQPASSFSSQFRGYYCSYFWNTSDRRNDCGDVRSRADYAEAVQVTNPDIDGYQYNRDLHQWRIWIKDNNVSLIYDTDYQEGIGIIDKLYGGKTDNLDDEYWWADVRNEDATRNAVGHTYISAKDGNFTFRAPRYYDPKYDPIKGYTFIPVHGDDIKLGNSRVFLDYYGFCCLATYTVDYSETVRYYIQFADEAHPIDTAGGNNAYMEKIDNCGILYVDKAAFEEKIKWDYEQTLSEKDVVPKWDDQHGFFHVDNAA